jgi:hypothetical protein
MQQRDGDATTGCLNMECPGFIKVSGAVIAPGDIVHPVDHVPGGPIQNITLKVNKVRVVTSIYSFHCHVISLVKISLHG